MSRADAVAAAEESVDRTPDPEDLGRNETPAYLQRNGHGQRLVADYQVLGSGWIRVTEWDGSRVKFPPHEVTAVREVQVESYGEFDAGGHRSKRLASEAHIDEARERSDG
jgi:hypothetical protein